MKFDKDMNLEPPQTNGHTSNNVEDTNNEESNSTNISDAEKDIETEEEEVQEIENLK